MVSEDVLDGRTILQFSKNMNMKEGLGQYLSGLDSDLLERDSATISRFYYTSDVQATRCEQAIGKEIFLSNRI